MGEMKNLQGRIKQLATEIEKGASEGLVSGRSNSQQEIDTQVDQSDEGFQKAECYGRNSRVRK